MSTPSQKRADQLDTLEVFTTGDVAGSHRATGRRPGRLDAVGNGMSTTNGTPELVEVLISRIRPSAINPRKHFDAERLQELAESIKSKGVLQPILLRPLPGSGTANPFFEIVAGERRYRACQIAGVPKVPATVRVLSDKEVLEVAVVENEQREDVTPLEKAEGYGRLVEEHGYSVEDLAMRVGKSVSTIRNLLRLRQLPEKARAALEAGELAPSIAELIASRPSAALRDQVATYALTRRTHWGEKTTSEKVDLPSYRKVKEWIAQDCMVELKGCPFRQDDDSLPGGSCKACPKRTGNNRELYPDGRADLCTDPACFREKVSAHKNRLIADAEGGVSPATVLSPAECQKLFPYERRLGYNAPYFDLAEQCPDDKKKRSYKQLVGEDLKDKICLAFDKEGFPHRLVPRDAAIPILREKHGLFKQSFMGSTRTSDEDKAEKAKRMLENRCKAEGDRRILQAAADGAEMIFLQADLSEDSVDILANQLLRAIAIHQIHHLGGAATEAICRTRQVKAKGVGEMRSELTHFTATLGGTQLIGWIAQLVTAHNVVGGWNGDHSELGKTICTALDLDLKKIRKEAEAAIKEEAKAKKAAKASSKKPSLRKAAEEHVKRQDLADRLTGESRPSVPEPDMEEAIDKGLPYCLRCGDQDGDVTDLALMDSDSDLVLLKSCPASVQEQFPAEHREESDRYLCGRCLDDLVLAKTKSRKKAKAPA
jgi:ParB/RepB/Spo0J family partition protein